MAILSKLQDNEAVVIDEMKLPEIKTKQMADILKNLQIGGQDLPDRFGRDGYRREQDDLQVGPQHPRHGGAAGVAVQRVRGACGPNGWC